MKHSWGGWEIIISAAKPADPGSIYLYPDRTGHLGEGLCLKVKSIDDDFKQCCKTFIA